ncbi:hypothetical protein FCULG_00008358 [Fusarium culmorum]|uniref:Uncharacterized protein n=1 Tax=Fusarium culmorum TaxID=5516 RepID=A0A2T4H335_FUSCU|nr:hypothetical protein FCULG_00008358 [Fusarium culmorum]
MEPPLPPARTTNHHQRQVLALTGNAPLSDATGVYYDTQTEPIRQETNDQESLVIPNTRRVLPDVVDPLANTTPNLAHDLSTISVNVQVTEAIQGLLVVSQTTPRVERSRRQVRENPYKLFRRFSHA